MTTDDLLFSNNSNIFVVDDETVRVSETRQQFHLRCHYLRPFLEGVAIHKRWECAMVCFHDLFSEPDRQRIYYFDCEREEKRLANEVDQSLRDRFVAFWIETMNPYLDSTPENMARWQECKELFAARGVLLPDHPSGDGSFRSLMHGVLSAWKGHPVGWQFETLIQVAHQLAQAHPENLLAFGHALRATGHDTLLTHQDVTGKWARRREQFTPRLKARDPQYMPNVTWLPALSFLFPEVGTAVTSFLSAGR
jgi:hypothetical protein